MKLNYALSLAIFLALMGTASATWPTAFNLNHVINFHNAMNFTAIDSNDALFYGTDIGKVNYVYITANNLAGTFLLQGYNGTTFIGNVSGYQFRTGIIVPLKTISGKSYNTLALFWNQSIGMATQSMEDYNRNVTIDINAVKYPLFEYLTGINITHPPLLYSVKDNVAFLGCTYLNNQTCSWQFRPKQPYFFIQTSAYPNQNISVDYIDTDGWGEAILSANSVTASILSKNWGGPPALTHSVTLPLNIVINASSAVLATNGIGWNGASYLYNAGGSPSIGLPTWIGTSNLATIKIYTDNAPNENTAFYLVPAYTTQYTNSTIFHNATPAGPSNSICNDITKCSCSWDYAENVTGLTWVANFTTLANYSNPGKAKIISINNVGYLMLNLTPNYKDYGTCSHPQLTFRALPYSKGSINYTIGHCDNQTMSVILSNTTNRTFTYNSFTMFFNNKLSQVGHEYDPSLPFETTYKGLTNNAMATSYSLPSNTFFIKFNQILGTNESISNTYLTDHSGIYGQASGLPYAASYNRVNSSNYDTLFLVKPTGTIHGGQYLYSYTLAVNYTGSTIEPCYYLINTTISILSEGTTCLDFNLYLTYNHTATGFYPYSTRTLDTYAGGRTNAYCNITSNNTKRLTLPPITKGSGTLLPSNYSNSSVWGNPGAILSGTTGTILFYDIKIPVLILIILALAEIVLIALAFMSYDEWVTIFGLVGANLFGLFIALGGGKLDKDAIFLLISLICAGYYVIKNIDKVWKHG